MDTADVIAINPAEIGNAPRRDPTFAVAFGGGGARGLAHINVIEALDEIGIKPVAIAGSSIGAIMGAAMSAGMSGAAIRDFARGVLCNRAEVTRRMWNARPDTLSDFMASGIRVSQFNIARILAAFLPPEIPDDFSSLRIPLQVTATDFYKQELVVLNGGDLRLALGASCAIPAVFSAVKHEGKTLIDGGIFNPVPFDLLEDMADIVIAVDVVSGPAEEGRRKLKALDMLFGANQIMMQAINQMKMKQKSPAIYLRPGTRYKALEFLKIDRVLAETVSVKDELKRAVDLAVGIAA